MKKIKLRKERVTRVTTITLSEEGAVLLKEELKDIVMVSYDKRLRTPMLDSLTIFLIENFPKE